MNQKSINKLRRRLIFTTTISFAAVMLLISGLMYLGNRLSTQRYCRIILNQIISGGGVYMSAGYQSDQTEGLSESSAADEGDIDYTPNVRDLLFPTESSDSTLQRYTDDIHYFTVYYDSDGNYLASYIQDDYITSAAMAQSAADAVVSRYFKFGSYGRYYYKTAKSGSGTMVVFLDSTELIDTNNRLLYIALILFGGGTILIFIIVQLLSTRMIAPELENAQRQKQFITNASHELKTPLAVIRANTEVEQMVNGENEWNTSTMRQVDRLTALIENLVMITRAEEREDQADLFTHSDVTKAIRETVETFRPVAEQDGKQLIQEAADDISLLCNESDIRQLASLLIDNAIKYCDEGGTITVNAWQRNRSVHLIVSNHYANGAKTDYSRFFDRFYRQDESHKTEHTKGGFGIGLSIAESLVDRYHGKIDVSWKDGIISFHCILK